MFDFPLLPEQASTFAERVDPLFWALTALTLGFCILVTVMLIAFGFIYGQRYDGRRSYHPESLKLELGYAALLTVIAMGIFAWGAVLYYDAYNVPDSTLDIDVIGKQWMWKVQHPNGKREVNELTVPKGRPVKLTMTSQDVIHSFFIPEFRLKQDVLPGRYTNMWFEATKTGTFNLFCAEYCGTEHSTMGGTVTVLEPEEYVQWLEGSAGTVSPADAGAQLFTSMGCVTCHQAGDNQRGPALDNLFGSEVELTSGDTVTADEDYIRNSILNPAADLVAGYAPLMPSYAGQLSDRDLLNLVAYIKSLGDAS